MENNQDEPEASGSDTSDLTDDDSKQENSAPPSIYMKRTLQQLLTEDKTPEGFEIRNGLRYRLVGSSSTMRYDRDTEDFLFRKSKKAKFARKGDEHEIDPQGTSAKEIKAAASEKEIQETSSEKELKATSEQEIQTVKSEKEIQTVKSEKEIQATSEEESQATLEKELNTTSEKENNAASSEGDLPR